MFTNRPECINFFHSVDDFEGGRVTKMPIAEAEALLAKHRGISSFTWMENFEGIELDSAIAERIINPEKLGLCYLGPEVGYGTVALEQIKKGEILIFSGEMYSKIPADITTNPYISNCVISS